MKIDQVKTLSVIQLNNTKSTKVVEEKDFILKPENEYLFTSDEKNLFPIMINWESKEIILSETKNFVELSKYPFFYQWQRENTKRLFYFSFENYKNYFVSNIEVNPAFIFSVGRCGSTLLVNLSKSIGIKTISEPDYLANINNRKILNQPIEEISDIIKWNTNLFSKSFGKNPLVKLRGSSINDIDVFAKIFPNTKYIFMFREPIAWAISNIKAFNDTPEELAKYLKEGVESYVQMVELGVQPTLIWYEDLIVQPALILKQLFENIEFNHNNILAIDKAMSIDSQEGSSISQKELAKKDINPEYIERFKKHWLKIYPHTLIEKYNLDRLLIN